MGRAVCLKGAQRTQRIAPGVEKVSKILNYVSFLEREQDYLYFLNLLNTNTFFFLSNTFKSKFRGPTEMKFVIQVPQIPRGDPAPSPQRESPATLTRSSAADIKPLLSASYLRQI